MAELSRKPKQIRNRLRRGRNLERDLQMYAEETGFKPVEEWDYVELARGRPRDKDGGFRGSAPKWITPKVVAEAKKRLQDKAFGSLMQAAGVASKTLIELMKDPDTDARTRADIAKFIYEQLNGKAAVKVDVEAKIGPADFLAGALVLDDGSPAHPIINGEFTAEDDEEEEDLRPLPERRP
ncbi:hypothetical protein [Phytohabitans aurantiacus]|uniref:hypothetical protein n=1 Tax=Phytohabitans aurantiacus TaxID=3016789 RepID=UPI0024933A3D|nr:hypothetical protein [Phytohabitans aurantiacus]